MTPPARTSSLSQPHLLGIEGMTVQDAEHIFTAAQGFRAVLDRPIKKVPSLRDITVASVFFEGSTRTRLSFELAAKRLSADVVSFSASASSVSKGETLADTVQNILAMKVDMVVLRHPQVGAPHYLARHVNAVVINAGDGAHEHPTQALLDAFTLMQRWGTLQGKRIAIVGDILHSRVALSNIRLLLMLGAEVTVCGPPTLMPRHIGSLGVGVSHHLGETLAWADAVNMLRIQFERQQARYFPSTREYVASYSLTQARLAHALKGKSQPLLIMHPGPMNRGVEISSEVADSDQAVILEQVLNGVAVRMAVLYLLVGGRMEGVPL